MLFHQKSELPRISDYHHHPIYFFFSVRRQELVDLYRLPFIHHNEPYVSRMRRAQFHEEPGKDS